MTKNKPKKEELILSTTTAIRHILNMPREVMEKHYRGLLNLMIWYRTEAGGKYNQIYESVGVKKMRDNDKYDKKLVQLEHVFTRKGLVDRLLKNPKNTEPILEDAIGCNITRDEHRLLHKRLKTDKDVDGWKRYRKAHIKVWNTETCKWKIDASNFI